MELKRDVPAPMLASISAGVFYPVLFAYLDWPGAAIRAHTARGTITWGGHDWVGVGGFGSVSVPEESMAGAAAAKAIVGLVGLPEDLESYADDAIKNHIAQIWWGCLTGRPGSPDGDQLVSDPMLWFSGTMDELDLPLRRDGANVLHNGMVGLSTGPSARENASAFHSHEDQQRLDPSDTAGRHTIMATSKAQTIRWPAS